VYFIKNIAVIYRQTREHLTQIQRKKEEKRNKSDKRGSQTSNLAQTQEAAPQNLSQLLAVSNVTGRSSSKVAKIGRSATAQGTRLWARHVLPQDHLAGEETMRAQKLEGPSTMLCCQPSTPTGTHKSDSPQKHLQRREVRWLHLEGFPYASGLKLQGHRRGS
jgi:hypothetical protein